MNVPASLESVAREEVVLIYTQLFSTLAFKTVNTVTLTYPGSRLELDTATPFPAFPNGDVLCEIHTNDDSPWVLSSHFFLHTCLPALGSGLYYIFFSFVFSHPPLLNYPSSLPTSF